MKIVLVIFVLGGLFAISSIASISLKASFAWEPNGADKGAKIFAPGITAKSSEGELSAKAFAPGQEAKFGVSCHNCAKDFAPGQEALKAGIIGPEIKK
jgi:hypothetical protein